MTNPTKQPPESFVQLPLIGEVAIYARIAYQGNVLATLPTPVEDLKAYAQALGFQSEQVTVFCDAGTKATAPLLQREGYTALLTAMRENRVHALFLHTAGRMFNGADELQVNTFIHLCIEKNVVIVTPQGIYDMQNLSHIAAFRATCVRAFEEIERVITRTRGGGH